MIVSEPPSRPQLSLNGMSDTGGSRLIQNGQSKIPSNEFRIKFGIAEIDDSRDRSAISVRLRIIREFGLSVFELSRTHLYGCGLT